MCAPTAINDTQTGPALRPGTGRSHPHWTGPVERRRRAEPVHERSDHQDLRFPDAHQTRTGQPHPSRHPRPRSRPLRL